MEQEEEEYALIPILVAGSSLTFILEEITVAELKEYLWCNPRLSTDWERVSLSNPDRNAQERHFQHLWRTLLLLVLFLITDFTLFVLLAHMMNNNTYIYFRQSTE